MPLAETAILSPLVHKMEEHRKSEAIDVHLVAIKPKLHAVSSFERSINAVYAKLRTDFVYPEVDRLYGVEGKAYFKITIAESGALQNVEAVASPSISLTDSFGQFMGLHFSTWSGGQNDDQSVATTFVLPISFKLQ